MEELTCALRVINIVVLIIVSVGYKIFSKYIQKIIEKI